MDIREDFFTERAAQPWKRLPRAVVEFPFTNEFKTHVDVALGDTS